MVRKKHAAMAVVGKRQSGLPADFTAKRRGKVGSKRGKGKPGAVSKVGGTARRRRSARTKIGIRDRLGQLTYRAACRLLGEEDGELRLLRGRKFEFNLAEDVEWTRDSLQVRVRDVDLRHQPEFHVTLVEATQQPSGLEMTCDQCTGRCEHVAGVLWLVLTNKLPLGLSSTPDPREPLENLTEEELVLRAIAERQERADAERMTLRAVDSSTPWTDYRVTSRSSGKSYRVALRGLQPGQSYCSCPDFRTNRLGTCKHILKALSKIGKTFRKRELEQPYRRTSFSLRVDYTANLGLILNVPDEMSAEAAQIVGDYGRRSTTNVAEVVRRIRRLERAGFSVHIYPDAEEFIEAQLQQAQLQREAAAIRANPADHPLRRTLLLAELLPYQLDGIAFAVGAGRAILADDMGLGKTIQGIGVAELLARLIGIQRVLVVCPASVKSQWRSEIHRFCQRDCQIVQGNARERAAQYQDNSFFKICNYEQILRDEATIEALRWDLIILDEGQRIKNWESKTSRVIKSLKSRFALVLSGTPLENRLEELYTVAGFVDSTHLGPAYRFFHQHRIVDDVSGRVAGYRNLDELREKLKPILLRRTRASVMQQLPPRTNEIVRIRPTEEQQALSEEHCKTAARIAAKRYLTEIDLLQIQKHLLAARMACNSTYLCDKQPPGFSSKLERLAELLEQLAAEEDRKIILFSEWTTMLNLIEPILANTQLEFVRLDGKVPVGQRQQLIHRFQHDASCRAIIMSNAGTTGLNLQAANTVINVDLPWNPAVLEQRIGRAHRMGQQQPVQVYLLVTEDTIEERMLGTLSAKHDLALAALDFESEVTEVELRSGVEALKRRLEQLLGEKPSAPVDASQRNDVERALDEQVWAEVDRQQPDTSARRAGGDSGQAAPPSETTTAKPTPVARRGESPADGPLSPHQARVAAAGGEMLGAVFGFLSELVQGSSDTAPTAPEVVAAIRGSLANCAQTDQLGRQHLTLTLPDRQSLDNLATTLARLLVSSQNLPGPS